MATITASTHMDSSQTLIQSETRYQEHTEQKVKVKKSKSRRHHKDEGSISVSKSSEKLNKKMGAMNSPEANPSCEKCGRPVYAMERVKAERRVWHKECFRCTHCQKQLTVETYQSDHTTLYCRNHFKQLFEPKPVDGNDEPDATPRKHQLIICENNPVELPPDVVKASDKPDLGLEELSQLDVKSRFEVFENRNKQEEQPLPEPKVPREKSTALLSKLAKFKAKGMDIGVSDDYLNGIPVEPSSSENEDENDEDSVLKKSYKHSGNREQPISFCGMSEIVGKFESGDVTSHERRRERKQEIQNIRTRLFMGKQAKIKEMYEQSVLQSEQGVTSADKISKELELGAEKARAIKQKFENGEVFNDENQPPKHREIEDSTLFDEGISKKSRSIFLELDANAKNMGPTSPTAQEPPKRKEIPFVPKDVIRASDKVEDVKIETADISDRFKFFETYKPKTEKKEFRMTPPRQTQRAKSPSPEVYVEPSIAREQDVSADTSLAVQAHTASKMISVFRNMEDHSTHRPQGPKPLKCFTPPPAGEQSHHPDYSDEESRSDCDDSNSDDEQEFNRTVHHDEDLKQAQQLARTTSFRDRFERWPSTTPATTRPAPVVVNRGNQPDEDDEESQLETAKSLREKFENMKAQSTVTKTFSSKVNRFV